MDQKMRDIRIHLNRGKRRMALMRKTGEDTVNGISYARNPVPANREKPGYASPVSKCKSRDGWLAGWRATDGIKRVPVVRAEDWTQHCRQIRGSQVHADVHSGAQLRRLGRRQRGAATVTFAPGCPKFGVVRPPIVQRLPHAAGMWWRNGDRQGQRGKGAHKHKSKQQSGGQTVHDGRSPFGSKRPTEPTQHRLEAAAMQAFPHYCGDTVLPARCSTSSSPSAHRW
jgi:hypothetical protein